MEELDVVIGLGDLFEKLQVLLLELFVYRRHVIKEVPRARARVSVDKCVYLESVEGCVFIRTREPGHAVLFFNLFPSR
jgi:hypothetical protein